VLVRVVRGKIKKNSLEKSLTTNNILGAKIPLFTAKFITKKVLKILTKKQKKDILVLERGRKAVSFLPKIEIL